MWALWKKLRRWPVDTNWHFSDPISQISDFHQIQSRAHPRSFSQSRRWPHKLYIFEESSSSTFQKHIVLPCDDVCGQSYGCVKSTHFHEIWSWEIRDLRNPRKKRPFLSTKFIFPLQALKPLQIWAETAQWARRTISSKWVPKICKYGKKNCKVCWI